MIHLFVYSIKGRVTWENPFASQKTGEEGEEDDEEDDKGSNAGGSDNGEDTGPESGPSLLSPIAADDGLFTYCLTPRQR
jgi:hypothetical protein